MTAAGEAAAGDAPRGLRPSPRLTVWLVAALAAAAIFLLAPHLPALFRYPESWFVPLGDWVDGLTDRFLDAFREGFRAAADVLSAPMGWLRDVLQWLPWPGTIVFVAVVAWIAGGTRLAIFAAAALLYMVVTGYWEPTMYTMAVTAVAVPVSIAIGLFVGIAAFRWVAVRRAVEPVLDMMQTIPPFAYLIPILVLFGLGPVVGLLATAIYAIPPMVRNVMLGLARVPPEIVESGRMSGSTPRQLLWWVQVPAAMGTILMGVNQTIMAGLSMVVIAAIVGGFPDIGLEVFNTMKKAAFGESILAGLVIALLAMLLDRVSRAFAARSMERRSAGGPSPAVLLWSALAFLAVIALLAEFVWPSLRTYPRDWEIYPADAMNHALEWFTVTFYDITETIKAWVLFYFLLPLKMGLEATVRPRVWGFEMNGTAIAVYAALVAALAGAAWWRLSWKPAVAIAMAALVYFFGTLGIPWIAFTLLIGVLAWQAGGMRLAALAVASLLFIAATGSWDQAMISLQLCGAGVLISFLIGATLGIWCALDNRMSAFMRPINDTLQTMPIFVFLIPAIMVFLVGEFTALVAIVMYATVPTIRYTEHGIRNVPADTVEAARAFGASRGQLLRQVELPMALPEIMLGLNQTIMMGLAMVVVAALVGAKGLGQEVMIALTWANVGKGMVSGLAVALIAIVTDRMIQSWALRKKAELGLT